MLLPITRPRYLLQPDLRHDDFLLSHQILACVTVRPRRPHLQREVIQDVN